MRLKLVPFFFILYLVGQPFASIAQQKEIVGLVFDADTRQPLPFTTVAIEKTSRGTVTNSDGKFNLVTPWHSNLAVIISFVGYEKQRIPINQNTSSLKIALKPVAKKLKEVVIVPNETLVDFIKDAYERIEVNYPQKSYQLNGFYRESLKDFKSGSYYYFGEAQLQLQGSGYQSKNEYGMVKIIQSRISRLQDSTEHTMYYGGAFIGSRHDIVKRRHHFLAGDESYRYELNRIEKLDDKEIWVIDFKHQENPIQGSIYIDRESKAYMRIDFTDSMAHSERAGKIVARETIVLYKKSNDRWYLQFAQSQSLRFRERNGTNEILSVDFNVNDVKTDSVRHLPLNEQLTYGQIFSMVDDNFSAEFWKGKTITLPDSALSSQMKIYNDTLLNTDSTIGKDKLPKRSKGNSAIYKILTRFEFNWGGQLLPYQLNDSKLNLTYQYGSSTLMFNSLKYPSVPLVISSGYAFRLNQRWQIYYTNITSLFKGFYFDNLILGIRYSMQLPFKGKPWFLRPSMAYGNHKFGRPFSMIESGTEIEFDGEKYHDKKMRFYAGEKVKYVQLSVTIQKHLKKLRWAYLNCGYQLVLKQEEYLFLKKENGLFKKIHSLPLSESPATLFGDMNTLRNFYFEAGLRFQF
jgi:hypothetical protein